MPPKKSSRPKAGKPKARTAARATRPRAAAAMPKPRTVTPYLAVSDAAEALEWYKKAFGAKELTRIPAGNRIMHASFLVGDSVVLLSDVFPGSDVQAPTTIGGTAVNLHIYIRNPDKLWNRALAAGAKVATPLENQFWGDRYGKITDPFGHSWGIAHAVKMTKAEKEAKMAEAMKGFGGGEAGPNPPA